jgi:hypothetical protein
MEMEMEGRWQDIDRLLLRDGNLAGPGFEPGPEVRNPWCFSPFSSPASVVPFGGWVFALLCSCFLQLFLALLAQRNDSGSAVFGSLAYSLPFLLVLSMQ